MNRASLTLPGQRDRADDVSMVRPDPLTRRRGVPECPAFLKLPARAVKPRSRGLTHVLDKGLTPDATRGFLEQCGHLTDIVKVGWGIGYIDPTLPARVALYGEHGCPVSLGGTLLEIAAAQNRVGELRDWALAAGITHVEVSNGLCALTDARKVALIRELSADFAVLAETGAKQAGYSPDPAGWAQEMARDLEAGAVAVIAEGRESGTVGLYHADQGIREDLVGAILDVVPAERVIFEAPAKAQQTWFVRQLGADVNLGNIDPASVLALETLRLGLRADTADIVPAGALT
jgi:phosphosulfolactate synthase